MQERESESEVAQSCPTLSDPMDCSLPGSSIHGIFQARVLEWGAITFSDMVIFNNYCSPRGRKELFTTEHLNYKIHTTCLLYTDIST